MSSLSYNTENRKNMYNNISQKKYQKDISIPKGVTSPLNAQNQRKQADSQIISGYFIKEKSYKEMVISRVNTFLCSVLALLVTVCLVSYYFVTMNEIRLNEIRKETLALNYENDDMQNKLDNLQSYYNVDRTVSKTKILQRANKVMELSAASVPSVKFDNDNKEVNPSWSMGY